MSDTAEEQAIAPLECSLTIEQFAKAEGFSPGTYYKLRALGMGPGELRVASTKIVRVARKSRRGVACPLASLREVGSG